MHLHAKSLFGWFALYWGPNGVTHGLGWVELGQVRVGCTEV